MRSSETRRSRAALSASGRGLEPFFLQSGKNKSVKRMHAPNRIASPQARAAAFGATKAQWSSHLAPSLIHRRSSRDLLRRKRRRMIGHAHYPDLLK